MKKYFRDLPDEIKSLISSAEDVSGETGMPVYLVGGFPRDLILGVKDWDIDMTVEGDGIKFAEALSARLGCRMVRHERFGTATLNFGHCVKLDIATARKEVYPRCAALPVVSPGSLKEDLFRRDFTINAMAVRISGDKGYELIDIFGGRKDLAAGRIRVLHEMSFIDDPTRILRGIRFQQRYAFRFEPKTLALLKKAVRSGVLEKVHPHRMRDELMLMFREKNPSGQLKRLCALCGLSFVSGGIKPCAKLYSMFNAVSSEVVRFMKAFPFHGEFDVWIIYLAVLLNPLSGIQAKEVMRKLGLSRRQAVKLAGCLKVDRELVDSLRDRRISPAQVFALLKPLSYEAIILLLASSRDKTVKKHVSDFLKVYNCLRLCISGDDLYKLGVSPGPRYQKILSEVLAARLNGKVKDRRGELSLVRKMLKTDNKGV
jgi:tRNA nucleotidyltransferase (CCA-adding enzyme)